MASPNDLYSRLAQLHSHERLLKGLEQNRTLEKLTAPFARLERDLLLQKELKKHENLYKFVASQDSLMKQIERTSRLHLPDYEWAKKQALLASNFGLPDFLERFRTPFEPLYSRIAGLGHLGLDKLANPAYLDAFNRTSAMADYLSTQERINTAVQAASRSFSAIAIPQEFSSVASYGKFLNAAGLVLPHWPRPRLLTRAERHRRLRVRLKQNAPPRHVIQAGTLTHKYEITMREIVDEALSNTYGVDWAETRLILCDCKDLLGKWRSRGGNPLDYADFAHYSKIMCYDEHFAEVFAAGFDDLNILKTLLATARKHRGAAVHGRDFSQEDLRDLRLTFRQLEIGLAALYFPDDEDSGEEEN